MTTNGGPVAVVPFGKYKGQPIETLAADREYCEWLTAQDWFRTRYTAIHTLIINHFGEPNETPEHNALQAKFLDTPWRTLFLSFVYGGAAKRGCVAQHTETVQGLQTDIQKHLGDVARSRMRIGEEEARLKEDAHMKVYIARMKEDIAHREDAVAKVQSALAMRQRVEPERCTYRIDEQRAPEFEVGGIDVQLSGMITGWFDDMQIGRYHYMCAIECKPSLGDEYPAVLRQVRAHATYHVHDIVAIQTFSARGATLEQVRKMFGNISIVVASDVDAFAERRQDRAS